MNKTRLSTKGQVVLPQGIRDAQGWTPGTELLVEETREGILLRRAIPFPPTTLDEVFGCLKWHGKPATEKDMDNAIAKAVRGRHARGRY